MSDGGIREYPKYIVPHADHSDPTCPGLILVFEHDEQAALMCNDCGTVFRTLRNESEADHALARMAGTGLAAETCPYCGHHKQFPRFTSMELIRDENAGAALGLSAACNDA